MIFTNKIKCHEYYSGHKSAKDSMFQHDVLSVLIMPLLPSQADINSNN